MADWNFYEWTTIIGLLISFLLAIGTIALAIVAFKTIREGRRSVMANRINEWARKSFKLFSQSLAPAKSKSNEILITNIRNMLMEINRDADIQLDAVKLEKKVYKDVGTIFEDIQESISLTSEYKHENEGNVASELLGIRERIIALLIKVIDETN